MELKGFRELEKALVELPRATSRNVLRRALKGSAEPIAEAAREKAPYDEKREAGEHLRDSIKIESNIRNMTGLSDYGRVLRSGGSQREAVGALRSARRGGGSEGTRVTVRIGPTAPHAHLLEFGTVKMAPHPYMRPAWDQEGGHALETIKQNVTVEIVKAAARIKRKTLRKR
jgi:HK97 gp10 family phage protein